MELTAGTFRAELHEVVADDQHTIGLHLATVSMRAGPSRVIASDITSPPSPQSYSSQSLSNPSSHTYHPSAGWHGLAAATCHNPTGGGRGYREVTAWNPLVCCRSSCCSHW
jgi:hypothetical protein